jgi:hypothetical protein
MRKIFFALMLVFAFVFASAAATALSIGSTSQTISNYKEDLLRTAKGSFTVTPNTTGTMACTVSPEAAYINTLEEHEFKNIRVLFEDQEVLTGTYSVTTGTAKTVSVTARIPENLDSTDRTTLATESFKVATITCSIGGSVIHTENLFMQRQNMLKIDEIEIRYDGLIDTISRDDGRITDLEPGTLLDLEVMLENRFRIRDYDLDIDTNVKISCDPEDIYLFNDEEDVLLRAESTDIAFFELDLEEDYVTDRTYKCTIEATGIDDYEAFHSEEWTIDLEVSRERYDLRIEDFTLSTTAVTCTDRDVTASLRVKNIGQSRDRSVKFEISSSALNLLKAETGIEIDEARTKRETFTFTVPTDLKSGTYAISAKVYSLGRSLSDEAKVNLVVPNCGQDPAPPVVVTPPVNNVDEQPPVVIVTPPVDEDEDNDVVVEETPGDEDEEENISGTLYLILLVVLVLVLLGGIIGLLVYLMKA